MRYIYPGEDERLWHADAHGIFSYKQLDEFSNTLRNKKHDQPAVTITSDPELPGDFLPSALWLRGDRILFLSEKWAEIRDFSLPTTCEVGTLITRNCGDFRAFDLTLLQDVFCARLDFEKSRFDAIRSSVLGFDPSKRILETKTNAKGIADLDAERPGPRGLRYWLPSNAALKQDWPWSAVAFDGLLFLREDIDLTDSGLVSTPMSIEAM